MCPKALKLEKNRSMALKHEKKRVTCLKFDWKTVQHRTFRLWTFCLNTSLMSSLLRTFLSFELFLVLDFSVLDITVLAILVSDFGALDFSALIFTDLDFYGLLWTFSRLYFEIPRLCLTSFKPSMASSLKTIKVSLKSQIKKFKM